jgi:AAA15 family ATPase/GTPase
MKIETLDIENFKSIKHCKLDCKKINVFIGKPNTGKSNILESIGLFSAPYSKNFSDVVRYETLPDIFHDLEINEKIAVRINETEIVAEFYFQNDNFVLNARQGQNVMFHSQFKYKEMQSENIMLPDSLSIKFYKFKVIEKFINPKVIKEYDFLSPLHGENLLSLLLVNKPLKKQVMELLREYGLKLALKPHDAKIDVQKEIDEVIIAYPYSLIADTLQRLIFHLAAIQTNHDSVLIFEEPETFAFPYYVKYLGERIAMDQTNQYFISTHNPYFLLSLLEKSPKTDICIFITYLDHYQTKVKSLTQTDLEEVMDLDASVFFNLERFLDQP